MKYDLVIWDFNGTIANDVQLGIECINIILTERGMKKVTDVKEYRDKFCFPIEEYYKKLGFDFDKEPYSIPAKRWTDEYIKKEKRITAFPGVAEVLGEIKKNNIKQIILSSSEITMLKRECDMLGITSYFDDILGLDNTFAAGKTELAKMWAKGKKYNAVFIGDTLHDYETAKAIGADCILFCGGHDSKEKLSRLNCPLVDSISEVPDYIL